jgi:GTP cyclohydrolase I/GTP cyclohydrolase-4
VRWYGQLVIELPGAHDMQASTPSVALSLSRAGVTSVHKAVRIRRGDQEMLMAAEISCTVDLDRGQKGVHMSRFPELFDEAIGAEVLGEGMLIEVLAEHIARHIVDRQQALRADVHITARWPMRRETPVTGLPTQEMVSLIGIAAADGQRVRRVVGVEATGINACPCAQGLVRDSATGRLREAGFADDDVSRILELVPLATHNQRGRGTLLVGSDRHLDAEELVGIVERSMSAPVFELLKRPDELYVVEHAHLQPRFVEDSVRVALKGLLDAHPELDDDSRPRRARRAVGHDRRAPRRARGSRPRPASDDARRLAHAGLEARLRAKRGSEPSRSRRMFWR